MVFLFLPFQIGQLRFVQLWVLGVIDWKAAAGILP